MDCIVLIGFMAAGKTTVGKTLAKLIEYDFTDTDKEIEMKYNMTIPDMFSNKGEKFFRDAERECVISLKDKHKTVISCGGGSVLNEDNVSDLKTYGIIIYLKACADTIINRLSNTDNRPLLKSSAGDVAERISDLLNEREKLYSDACDICIETDSLSVEDVADKLKKMLKY